MKKINMILISSLFVSSIVFLGIVINKKVLVGAHDKSVIKYIDFSPTLEVLKDTMDADISSHQLKEKNEINWINALSYLGTRYGGNFKRYQKKHLKDYIKKIKNEEEIEISNKKLYEYYVRAYSSILTGVLGEKEFKKKDDTIVKEYGIKISSPIPRGHPFTHYDDFGARRTFGFRRPHLGHDLFCAIGTPVLAVEEGDIEIMGWNKFGGWRIGIRSHDKLRYWYYAHLRKDKPFNPSLHEGDHVKAGDHIGYVGRTGYSDKENVNNIKRSHLHLGLQIIFDEKQKEGPNQIWISLYNLINLLKSKRV